MTVGRYGYLEPTQQAGRALADSRLLPLVELPVPTLSQARRMLA